MPTHMHAAKILIVDDNVENIQLLFDLLTEEGYTVFIARNGADALLSLQHGFPDLILLDVLMPEMDGFEVCRRLKQDERTRDIPVIFLTALAETFDKVRGFEVGGVDYITKPFQAEEILARIKSPLALYHTQRQLIEQNRRLQEEIAERQRSEERYRLLADNAADVIWTTDLQGHLTYISPSVERLKGYTPDEAMQHPLEGVFTPESAALLRENLQHLAAQDDEGPRQLILETLCKDGTTLWTENIVTLMFDSSGQRVGLLGVMRDISDRKQMEKALRRSEERYRQLVENITEVIYTVDVEGIVTYVSPSISTLCGFSPQEMEGRHLTDWVVPEDRPMLRRSFAKRPYAKLEGMDWRILRKCGGYRWVHSASQPIMSAGIHLGLQGVLTDISSLKQTEAALREHEARLQFALNTLDAGVWEHDLTTGQAMWDEQTYRLFGRSPSSGTLMVEDVAACILPEDLPDYKPEYQQTLASGDFWNDELRVLWPDGSIHWLYTTSQISRDDAGRAIRLVGLCFDITERKQMEEALRHSEERYRQLVEQSYEAIYTIDEQHTITYSSPAIQKITGFSPDELIGQSTLTIVLPEDAPLAEQTLQEWFRGKQAPVELRLRHRTEGVRWVQTSGSLIDTEDDTATIRGMLIDITERKRAELALQESEARLKIALNALQAGVWEHDLITNRSIWDAHTYRLFGIDPSHSPLTLKDVQHTIHPEDRAAVLSETQQHIAAADSYETEYRIIWPDGSLHWMYSAGAIVCNEAGQAMRLVGLSFDITERKQMETALRQTNADLKHRNEELITLNQISKTLTTIIGLEDILNRVAEIMTHQFNAGGAVIGLIDLHQEVFIISAHETQASAERGDLLKRVWPLSQIDPDFRRKLVTEKRPVVITNARHDPCCAFMRELLSSRNIHSLMQIPLLARGEVLGIILLSSEQPEQKFTLEQAQFAETIAG